MGWIREPDDRSEVVLVGINFVRHEEIRRIETGKSREPESFVRGLSEVLVANTERQREIPRRLPRILEEVALAQKVRLVERNAEVDVCSAVGAAEVVDEVCKAREPTTRRKCKWTTFIERRTLARGLS